MLEIFQGPRWLLSVHSAGFFKLCFLSSSCLLLHFSGGVCLSSSWNIDALLLQFVFMCSAILYLPLISHLSHAARIDVIVFVSFFVFSLNVLQGHEKSIITCFHPLSLVLCLCLVFSFFLSVFAYFSLSLSSFSWMALHHMYCANPLLFEWHFISQRYY